MIHDGAVVDANGHQVTARADSSRPRIPDDIDAWSWGTRVCQIAVVRPGVDGVARPATARLLTRPPRAGETRLYSCSLNCQAVWLDDPLFCRAITCYRFGVRVSSVLFGRRALEQLLREVCGQTRGQRDSDAGESV